MCVCASDYDYYNTLPSPNLRIGAPQGPGWEYETELPDWASIDWIEPAPDCSSSASSTGSE